ncbi:long-chain-fatty-acid--CoA ligase heimdall-like [Musca vetustissima]|uniref:long-chain-fatty-acid--CoA ligase heimdall-like n=1 Tax=Musca vetustissima TaxID=27455 RepID=UPI002AB75E12|nr:long-chain-fatty-acid--CoA ligase heimdall-like [Musca vetustissima]
MSNLKPALSSTTCSLHEPVKILASEENLLQIKPQTIPEFFHACCERFRDRPALAYKDEGVEEWTTISYGEYEKNVEQTALLLLHLGVQPRTSVGILSYNCPEWFYVNLAVTRINAVSTGIYTTNSAEAVHHILETSDASVVVVDDSQQLEKIRAIRSSLPQLKVVVQLHGPFDFGGEAQTEGYWRWSDLFQMQFSPSLREDLYRRERQVMANECALIIFTSGTVGMPKGCMISHDAIVYLTQAINHRFDFLNRGHERIVSYLPLNHVAGQLYATFMAMDNGTLTYFADRNALKGTLVKNFIAVQPTMLFGVPRVFEKIHEQLLKLEERSNCFRRMILQNARAAMLEYHVQRIKGKPTSFVKYWLASMVINRIKNALGLSFVKDAVIGGAPSSDELKSFFMALNGGTGIPVEGVEIKIKDPKGSRGEGEILMRGRTNFTGYLKDPLRTKEAVTEDGLILSGDIGYLDARRNLFISGRIKELIVTAGGENIPPVYIEDRIKKELPCLSNVMAIGDRRKYLTALLTFKTDMDPNTGYPQDTLLPESKEWLATLGLHYTHLSEMLHMAMPGNLLNFDPSRVEVQLDEKLEKALKSGIERYNRQAISNAQKIQYFTVLPHDFSIPTGELGPTLKIRRNVVHNKYAKVIDRMYCR